MVWGPQLLYIMHNSPQWIPRRWFTRIDSLFRSLIWKKKVARIRLSTLQYDKDQGGAAVPNPKFYFLASQMQHLCGMGRANDNDSIDTLLRAGSGSASVLASLEAGFPHLPRAAPTVVLLGKLWSMVRSTLGVSGFLVDTPLWNNLNLMEVFRLHGLEISRD